MALVGIAVLVPSTTFALQRYAERQFRTVQTAMDVVRLPAGAVDRLDQRSERGRNLEILSCLPDAHCPAVEREWFVPVAAGDENAFIDSVFDLQGYVRPWAARAESRVAFVTAPERRGRWHCPLV